MEEASLLCWDSLVQGVKYCIQWTVTQDRQTADTEAAT